MKGVKGKLLKKLKTMKTIGYLKPERILQVNALDGFYSHTSPQKPRLSVIREEQSDGHIFPVQEPEIIDVSELMKDLDDRESEFDDEELNDKENVRPETKAGESTDLLDGKKEFERDEFRRPDLNSKTLFDPNLLAAFEQAVMDVKAREAERRSLFKIEDVDEEPPLKSRKTDNYDPLLEFEYMCPPGGGDSIVFYTTGIRGVRKTFEDCQRIRSLLENLRVLFLERDISMHSEYKEEMWRVLGGNKLVAPRLFIKGRYIGGADEVLGLHEQGRLKPLIQGIPIDDRNDGPCEGCVGFRFIVCFNCNGSRKIVPEEDGRRSPIDCSECNENGVIVCPFCC